MNVFYFFLDALFDEVYLFEACKNISSACRIGEEFFFFLK
jgi:hypothetical protein